jgi:hypothetical protein
MHTLPSLAQVSSTIHAFNTCACLHTPPSGPCIHSSHPHTPTHGGDTSLAQVSQRFMWHLPMHASSNLACMHTPPLWPWPMQALSCPCYLNLPCMWHLPRPVPTSSTHAPFTSGPCMHSPFTLLPCMWHLPRPMHASLTHASPPSGPCTPLCCPGNLPCMRHLPMHASHLTCMHSPPLLRHPQPPMHLALACALACTSSGLCMPSLIHAPC